MKKEAAGKEMVRMRTVQIEDRKVSLGHKSGRWIVQFKRPPQGNEGDKPIFTKFSLSDEAMQALVHIYMEFSIKEPLDCGIKP